MPRLGSRVQVPSPAPFFMLAIISGSGNLPAIVQGILLNRGENVLMIDIFGNEKISAPNNVLYRMNIGQIGKILKLLGQHKIDELLFIGGLSRPSFRNLHFDLTGLYWYFRIYKNMKKGDNNLLTTILNMLRKRGFKIRSIPDTAPELLAGLDDSCLPLSKQNLKDIEIGAKILNDLSKHDIGQAIVIQNGLVLGIEAIEGTDNLLRRVKSLKRDTKTGGVLVKLPKVNQTDLADLPTIGPDTILNAKDAALDGIAIKANKTIIVDRQQTMELAKKFNIFIKVIN